MPRVGNNRMRGLARLAPVLLAALIPWETPAGGPASGRFSILTYNVAGLPQGISSSQPIIFTSMISPRLNGFDIVLCQEDFFYHQDLKSRAEHPYISGRSREGILGDGLSRFSVFPFTEVDHVAWEACYGTLGHANDCLTPKGYSFAVHELAPGVYIDIYNLHMDAGGSPGDNAAKAVETEQLIKRIRSRSAGRAVIVAGDMNMKRRREPQRVMLEKILSELDLTDSRVALSVGEDRIDRILYRSGDKLELTPASYRVELERFRHRLGGQLSDHEAVSVVFEWKYAGD